MYLILPNYVVMKKYHIKAHLTTDCYSKVNLTVTKLPGDLLEMDVKAMLQESNSWKSKFNFIQHLSSVQFWTM